MKWKKLLSGTLAMMLAASPVIQASPLTVLAEETENIYTVSAPTEDLEIQFWLDDSGAPWYQVVSDGAELIEDAKLGLNTSLGALNTGLALVGTPVTTSGDSTWEPVVGEQGSIRDCYNETSFTLSQEETGLEFGIVMRAYDEGVAFRYVLPEIPEGSSSYTISDEYTQFVFAEGAKASLHVGNNQTVPREYAVESLPSGTIQRPATIEYKDGQILTICEGNLENYSVMTMAKSSTARAFEANYAGTVTVDKADGPDASPWRVMVIGGDATELLENDTIIQNLNEPADEETYKFSEWLDPGTCVRATTGLNNTAIKSVIDLASEHGIRYVLLDSGWYGPEYDANADPRLDPAVLDPDNAQDKILLEKYFATEGGYNNTGEGVFNTNGNGFNQYGSLGDGGSTQINVDIPALCEYANAKGVGIVLYVNGVFFPDSSGRDRFTADELFAYYEKWGVAGVKPGFVKVRSQANEQHMEEVIAAAANHKLVLTVHDEYVPTGLERTYPNLMMTEGILGDESIGRNSPQVAEDITTIFTRNVQGPPDHTYCYPGKATKAYALASPIMFRSGMSVIYWYTNPGMVPPQDMDKMAIWDHMPTTWEESLFLEGSLYEYATTARRSADDVWYVGSLSAISRTLQIPLEFLDEGVTYVADVYADGVDADPYAGWTTSATAAKSQQTLENKQYLVTSETVLQRNLEYGFGYAVVLTKATEEDLATYSAYNVYRQELELELARAEAITASDYSIDSWSVYETAKAAAEETVANVDATDEQMEKAIADLKNAREALVSTESLERVIAGTVYYTSYHFTTDSYQVLADAVAAAEELLAGGNYTQAQLDEAEVAILAAIEGLTDDPNRVLKNTVYLDELSYDTARSYAYSNAIKKKVDYYGSTLSLMIDGTEQIFDRGMMTHAQSEVYYNIEGKGYELFEAYVGVDTIKATQGNVIFRVYGDDVLLYESAASGNGSQNAQFFSIPIAGVKELHIEANMNGSNDGDHAVWADAKFLTYQDPNAYLKGIKVNGTELVGFAPDNFTYFYQVNDGQIPKVDVILDADDFAYEIEEAKEVPGYTRIIVTKRDGSTMTYRIYFLPTKHSAYISDLASLITKATVHTGSVTKDAAYGGAELALTAADGTSKLSFEKGIGTHASSTTDSMVVYNIAGKGFDVFEGYVGISYTKNDSRATVNFKVYVDDETTPRFESGKMEYRTPAMFYSVDVRGAETLTLVVDACGDQSADHGCWADAKFLNYTGVQTVSGTVDVTKTGLDTAGIAVNLYEVIDGDMAGTPIETAITDENGVYIFANIIAGDYVVKIEKGDNHFETSAQITVAEEAVVQDLRLEAPEFDINITQPDDAIVVVDNATAARGEVITVYVKEIAEGKVVSEVNAVGSDGTVIDVAAIEGKEDCYVFTMLQQEVNLTVVLADDEAYQEAVGAAQAVDEKILSIGEVTLDKKDLIEGIRAEYEQLSDAAKVHVQKLALLEHSENMLEALGILGETEAAGKAAEAAKTAAEKAQAVAESAQAAAEEAQAASEVAQSNAEAAQKKADAAQTAIETAQAAAEAAAESAAEDKQAAEAAKKAAETAKAEAQAAKEEAENAKAEAQAAKTQAETAKAEAEAAQEAAENAAGAAQNAAEAAAESNASAAEEAGKAAEEALKAAAESAKAATESAKAAAEAQKATEAAEKAAGEAQKAAVSAAAAADAQAKAQEAQEKAEAAGKAAEDAQIKAEAAQKAAEDAAESAAEDKQAAEDAKAAADAAKKAAEDAQAKAEAAQKAAEDAKDAAAKSDASAAAEALKAAEEAKKATEQAKLVADYAAQVADAQAKAQEAQEKAEAAQKAAEDAAGSAEKDKQAAEEAKAAAEAAKKEAEEAQKKAEAAQAAAEFATAKQMAMLDLMICTDRVDADAMSPNQRDAYNAAVDKAVAAINEATAKEELEGIVSDLKKEVETIRDSASANRFVDVVVDDWFYEVVDYVAYNNLMTGLDETHFGPYESLSRAQFALILYRMAGKPEVDIDKTFDDIIGDEWYGPAVLWAAENGIVTGYGDGIFGPVDLITREQMAVMMYRYADYLGKDTTTAGDISTFNDVADVSEFAAEAIQWANGMGIITGKENGTVLDPQGATARPECAAIVMRFIEKYKTE